MTQAAGAICFSIKKDCISPDSYGEICVGCQCCSKDPKIRYPARLKLYQERLERDISFNYWIKGVIRLQKRNIKSNITYDKRRVAIYKRLTATLAPEMEGRENELQRLCIPFTL